MERELPAERRPLPIERRQRPRENRCPTGVLKGFYENSGKSANEVCKVVGIGRRILAERPRVEQALSDVCNRSELTVECRAKEHAGGKWQHRYASALGGGANLQVDINFMLRLPLWPIVLRDSKKIGCFQTQQIPLLDINELAAAILAALLARHAARDLFDAHQLLTPVKLDDARLRYICAESINPLYSLAENDTCRN